MFNIGHCVYAACIMNGSGNLEEDYRQPIHLCPVDLRKFQHALSFDVEQRYLALLAFFVKYNMPEDAKWIQDMLKLMKITEIPKELFEQVQNCSQDEECIEKPRKRQRIKK